MRVASVRARARRPCVLAAAVGRRRAARHGRLQLHRPQATTEHYDASDGCSGTVGDLDVRNAIVVTDDGHATANLVMTLVNSAATTIAVTPSSTRLADGDDQTSGRATVPALERGAPRHPARPAAARAERRRPRRPASSSPVYFQYGTETGDDARRPRARRRAARVLDPAADAGPSGSTDTDASRPRVDHAPSPEDGTPSATPTPAHDHDAGARHLSCGPGPSAWSGPCGQACAGQASKR